MHITVIGSGSVGRTLAAAFAAHAHDVVLASRNPAAPDLVSWSARSRVRVAAPRDATADASVVVNATPGSAALDAVRAAGVPDGAILLDVSNPLDFSTGSPTLTTSRTESVAEHLQAAFPKAKVVKSLCTVNASIMVNPAALPEPTTQFVAGDDADAKSVITGLLTEFGWKPDQILDLALSAARSLESNILFWLDQYTAIGTLAFNVKIVHA